MHLGRCQKFGKKTGGIKIRGRIDTIQTTTSWISAKILRDHGDLRRFAVTDIPVKDFQLTLVWKTLKRVINIIFDIQMNHQISSRRPDLVRVRKKKKRRGQTVDIAVPADHRLKLKVSENRDKYQGIARELKQTMEHKSDGDTYSKWRTRYSNQRISTGTEGLEIRGRVETIQRTALLRSARIVRRVLET